MGFSNSSPSVNLTAVLTPTITDSDTTHAPDGNSVFDALALKAPLASPVFTGTPTLPSTTGNFQAGNAMGFGGVLYIGTVAGANSPLCDAIAPSIVRWRSAADATSPVWHINQAGMKRVSANVNNATATMANISDLTNNVVAGRFYTGHFVFKCVDSTAAEGIAFDFDGGTCTMTNFAASAEVITGGAVVAANTVSGALATDFNWTTITGETWIRIAVSFTVNAAGTFIPRFCQGTAHTSGTATVNLGSYSQLIDTP